MAERAARAVAGADDGAGSHQLASRPARERGETRRARRRRRRIRVLGRRCRASGCRGRRPAEQREGLREAARYYERALDLLGDSDPVRSLELRQPLGRTYAQLGELRQADEELGAVATDALALGRPDVRGAALVGLGNIDHRQGRPSDARRRLMEARELGLAAGDRSLQVRAAFCLAAVRADYEAGGVGAADDLRHAVAIAEEIDDRALRVEGHLRLGFL